MTDNREDYMHLTSGEGVIIVYPTDAQKMALKAQAEDFLEGQAREDALKAISEDRLPDAKRIIKAYTSSK